MGKMAHEIGSLFYTAGREEVSLGELLFSFEKRPEDERIRKRVLGRAEEVEAALFGLLEMEEGAALLEMDAGAAGAQRQGRHLRLMFRRPSRLSLRLPKERR